MAGIKKRIQNLERAAGRASPAILWGVETPDGIIYRYANGERLPAPAGRRGFVKLYTVEADPDNWDEEGE